MSYLLLTTALLEQIRERPRMYFQPPILHALFYYLDGCHATLRQFAPDHPLCAEIAGFDDWVRSHLRISVPSLHWWQIIRERASDDTEQARMFIDLFLAYRRERDIDPFAPLTRA